jgi:hypothetical protein
MVLTRPMIGLLAALAVPLAVTGLFTAGASDAAVVAFCVAVLAALAAVGKPLTRWAGAGWALGCVIYAVALVLLFGALGTGLEQIG